MVLLVFVVPVGSFLLFGFGFGISLMLSVVATLIVFSLCCVVFYLFFHRNPNRKVTSDDYAVLSPADGRIVYIKKIQCGNIIESVKHKNPILLTELSGINEVDAAPVSGYVIGIELRLFDVHVTRAPVSGAKLWDHHKSGRIISMGNPDFEYINDHETVLLQTDGSGGFRIAVVQIATFLTRTVKSFVREKTRIAQGEPLGMFRLGSQVDIVLFSPNVHLLVKEHDRVYAGLTRIAEIT